jgi:hypothetical protein
VGGLGAVLAITPPQLGTTSAINIAGGPMAGIRSDRGASASSSSSQQRRLVRQSIQSLLQQRKLEQLTEILQQLRRQRKRQQSTCANDFDQWNFYWSISKCELRKCSSKDYGCERSHYRCGCRESSNWKK